MKQHELKKAEIVKNTIERDDYTIDTTAGIELASPSIFEKISKWNLSV